MTASRNLSVPVQRIRRAGVDSLRVVLSCFLAGYHCWGLLRAQRYLRGGGQWTLVTQYLNGEWCGYEGALRRRAVLDPFGSEFVLTG